MDAKDRMARLRSGPLCTEARTISAMIEIYCHAHHGKRQGLCPECLELEEYALKRLACCPFGEHKPACADCRIHCYKPAMKERIRIVMRFSGPRMLLHHPVLAFEHLWKSWTVKPPEKPRNIVRPPKPLAVKNKEK